MKIRNLMVYALLFGTLTADSQRFEVLASGATSATATKVSNTTYVESWERSVPLWVQVLFFGAPQPLEAVPRVTLDEEVYEEVPPLPEPEPEPTMPVYTYGDFVPESERQGDDFFANTAIIGDSRSQGLMLFSDMPGANLAGMGLSVYNIWEKKYVETSAGNFTCLQALERGTYDTIYISLGANCMGYLNVEKFYSNFCKLIDEIRVRQPNAVIYAQNIMAMNEPILKSRNYAECFNNDAVREYNTYIQRAAKEKNLFLIDLYSAFLDDTEQLPKEASTDGLHLTATYAKMWAEHLRTHTINPDEYFLQAAVD